jgi:integrase
MARFTDRHISGLKTKPNRYEEWEGNGFGIRVSPRGIKSFVWVYHFEGQSRRMTLGQYPALPLAQARIDLAAAQKKLGDGEDPSKKVVAERKAERQAETVMDLGEKYIRLHAKVKKRTWKEDERILKKEIYPHWGNRKARNITRQNIVSILDEIAVRGPIMANRTRALLSKMFRWGISRGDLNHNPVEHVERPGQERRRERRLAESEINKFWNGLDDAGLQPGIRIAIRLLLVTLQRRAEVAGMVMDEIEETNGIWTIPGSRTKNKQQHKVPLSTLALSLIRQARTEAAKRLKCEPDEITALFPSRIQKKAGMSIVPDALTKALNRSEKEIGTKVSPHDLRRTAHTIMGSESIGVHRFVRDRILNHSDQTPGAHYDVNEYLPEKRKALDAWGEFLSEKVKTETGNVIEIGARRDV